MSNNNASNNLLNAQRAVKQLRFEASIRRIKVTKPRTGLEHGRGAAGVELRLHDTAALLSQVLQFLTEFHTSANFLTFNSR